MKMVSLRIFVAVIGVGGLLVIAPDIRSDDATDWANQQAQAQKERDDWYNQQAQAQKDREDLLNQQAQAQREAEQAQKDREWNEYLNEIRRDTQNLQKWAADQASARQEEINQAQPAAPEAARPAAIPPNQPMAGPAQVLAAPPAAAAGAKQPKTYTVAINNGSQVTRTTFVMADDGSWHRATP
jgi:hypothetical protein